MTHATAKNLMLAAGGGIVIYAVGLIPELVRRLGLIGYALAFSGFAMLALAALGGSMLAIGLYRLARR